LRRDSLVLCRSPVGKHNLLPSGVSSHLSIARLASAAAALEVS
jgi:hypothetical protein